MYAQKIPKKTSNNFQFYPRFTPDYDILSRLAYVSGDLSILSQIYQRSSRAWKIRLHTISFNSILDLHPPISEAASGDFDLFQFYPRFTIARRAYYHGAHPFNSILDLRIFFDLESFINGINFQFYPRFTEKRVAVLENTIALSILSQIYVSGSPRSGGSGVAFNSILDLRVRSLQVRGKVRSYFQFYPRFTPPAYMLIVVHRHAAFNSILDLRRQRPAQMLYYLLFLSILSQIYLCYLHSLIGHRPGTTHFQFYPRFTI